MLYNKKLIKPYFIFLFLLVTLYTVYFQTDFTALYLRKSKSELMEFVALNFILAVIVAPIIEEVVFRGYLLNFLIKRFDTNVSVLISSIVWAILHIPAPVFSILYIFLLGVSFGWMKVESKKIYHSMLCHVINNLVFFIFFGEL